VVLDGEVLGKPSSPDEAMAMLSRLSGRSHVVVSGLALALPDGRVLAGTDRTEVRFRPIHPEQVRRYVETGEPMDKAGAYGIQGRGGALVDRVNGDYFTVVGLPLSLLMDLLEEAGWRYQFGELVPIGPETD
jgi:septum formation protein